MKSGILFLGLTYCSVASIQAQETKPDVLTNTNVIGMVKAGLSQSLMITTINNNECNFSLDVENLIVLKQARIPDPVIRAMFLKDCKSATASTKVVQDPGLGAVKGTLTKELRQQSGVHVGERGAIVVILKGAVAIPEDRLVTVTATNVDLSAPADASCISAARSATPKTEDEALGQLRALAACAAKSVQNRGDARTYEILRRTVSDQEGHFEIINVPPGDYTLMIKSHTEALTVRDMVGKILVKPIKIETGKTLEVTHDFDRPEY